MNQQDPMLSMLKWLCKQILVLFKPNLSDYPFPTVSKLHPTDKKQTSTKDCLNYDQKKRKIFDFEDMDMFIGSIKVTFYR